MTTSRQRRRSASGVVRTASKAATRRSDYLSVLNKQTRTGTAQRSTVRALPRAPGARLVTLPRDVDDQQQETCVAVHPHDSSHVIVSYYKAKGNYLRPERPHTTHVAWSKDGGRGWANAIGDSTEGIDAIVTIDPHGHAFLAFLGRGGDAETPLRGIYMRRSLDGGVTWEPGRKTVIEEPPPGGLAEMPFVVADSYAASPHAGNVYVTWCHFWGLIPPSRSFTRMAVQVARSTDDGKSWSPPILISPDDDAARGVNHTPDLWVPKAAVGPDGSVYVTWKDYGSIMLAVSRDGGQTFDPARRVLPAMPTPSHWSVENFPRSFQTPVIAVDPRTSPGKLVVVWPAGDWSGGITTSIFASTSDDGGRTWTSIVRVNDDELSYSDQVLPAVAVDPTDGAINIAFFDRRADPRNRLARVTLARSEDGGSTYRNYAWSVRPTNPMRATHGDYIGAAAVDGSVYGAWPESVASRRKVKTPASGPRYFRASGPAAIRFGIADFLKADRTQPRILRQSRQSARSNSR